MKILMTILLIAVIAFVSSCECKEFDKVIPFKGSIVNEFSDILYSNDKSEEIDSDVIDVFQTEVEVLKILSTEKSKIIESTTAVPSPKSFYFTHQPKDHIIEEGFPVTLACAISRSDVTVQWTKDNFGLGIDRNLTGYPRYSMIGENGNFSLHISPTMANADNGFYQCQFSNKFTRGRSRYAKLTVVKSTLPVNSKLFSTANSISLNFSFFIILLINLVI